MKTTTHLGSMPTTKMDKSDRKAIQKATGILAHAANNVPGCKEPWERIAADIAMIMGRFDDDGNEKPGAA